MAAKIHLFRLADAAGLGALQCVPEGVFLAKAALLAVTPSGFAPRPDEELGAPMLAAYGRIGDLDRLSRGLRATAACLNRGDLGLAQMAALHLRLSDVSAEGSRRIAAVDDFLAKYDPDEPRDWHGRWTTGGAGNGGTRSPPAPGSGSSSSTDQDWSGPSHPTGGRFILTGGGPGEEDYGRNEPRDDGFGDPTPPPSINEPRVPSGWDENVDGAVVRKPELRDGRLWPEASVATVMRVLAVQSGARQPRMRILVPRDGKGPILVGSDESGDYQDPPGYDRVDLIGSPQETSADGRRTNHASDSVETALRWASTNKYERFYFNSAISTSTAGSIQSQLRPDVLAVARPELEPVYRFEPYESYSPRQDPLIRRQQLQLHPDLAPVEGQFYKFLRLLLAELRKLGKRRNHEQ